MTSFPPPLQTLSGQAIVVATPARLPAVGSKERLQPGRIGPNAITRMAEALDAELGPAATRRLFGACGLAGYLDAAPEHMVDERAVASLHAVIAAELDPDTARIVSWSAGTRTGDYLLAKRIPRAVQWLVRTLPASLASRMLLAAIARNAWTFVGSGQFQVTCEAPVRIAIVGCPICRELATDAPGCGYFAATFERLYRTLVHPKAEVREVGCAATGSPACEFEIWWRNQRGDVWGR